MKRYIVFKFFGDKAHASITEAVDAETALNENNFATSIGGTFKINNMFGEGGFAIELEDEMINVSLLSNRLRFLMQYQKVIQNNIWLFI